MRPAHGETPYLRFGSWPMYGIAALLLGLALVLRPALIPGPARPEEIDVDK